MPAKKDAEKKYKPDPNDILNASLLMLSEFGNIEKYLENSFAGTGVGLKTFSTAIDELIKTAGGLKSPEELFSAYTCGMSGNIASIKVILDTIKKPQLRAYAIFVSTNLTAASMIRAEFLTVEDLPALSAYIAFLSPETVRRILGLDPAAEKGSEGKERPLGANSLPENFMEGLESYMASKDKGQVDAALRKIF